MKLQDCKTPEDVKKHFTCDADDWEVWSGKKSKWYGWASGIVLIWHEDGAAFSLRHGDRYLPFDLKPRALEVLVGPGDWLYWPEDGFAARAKQTAIEDDGEILVTLADWMGWHQVDKAYKWIGMTPHPILWPNPEKCPDYWAKVTGIRNEKEK